jgi:flagellar basal-body rod modification protein FlgD
MATSSVGAVSQDQMLQLLIAQLQNQDPLEPTNATEFVSQLSQLSTVGGLTTLNASFSEMLKLQQLTQGTDLIGKTVDYNATGGGSASGKVDSLKVQDGKFVLQIGNTSVNLDQIQSVKN